MESLYVNTNIERRTVRYSSSELLRSNILKGRRILVIEDDYVNYLFLREMLNCFGVDVYRAVSIEQAIKRNNLFQKIDLLIINNSLTCNKGQLIKFITKEFSGPIMLLVKEESKQLYRSNHPNWVDQIISLHTDSEALYEILSESINKVNSRSILQFFK